MHPEDQTHLVPWTYAFERVFSQRPELVPFTSPGGSALWQLKFPKRVYKPDNVVGQTGHFSGKKGLVTHLQRLGFDWTGEQLTAAPTPMSFNVMLQEVLGARTGYSLKYLVRNAPTMTMGPWLEAYCKGHIPIHVCTQAYYMAHAGGRGPQGSPEQSYLGWHLTTLIHDLTVHGLNYHLIPVDALERLGKTIYDALPERTPSWSREGSEGPLTLSYFFDNDLNRYCYEVWFRSETPEDFTHIFSHEPNLRQLFAGLETRLEETRSGKGEVVSGDSNQLPALKKVEFALQRIDGRR